MTKLRFMPEDPVEELYNSKESGHYLDSSKINEILAALYQYQNTEIRKAFDREGRKDVVYIIGLGANFDIGALAKDYSGFTKVISEQLNKPMIASVQLGKLTVSNGKVHLKINEQKNLLADPKGLEEIAKQFKIWLH